MWISKLVLNELLAEADRCFPDETGGVLFGYEPPRTKDLVITHIIGPGPNARHENESFVPDSLWQQAQIDDYYRRSGGIETYLGDWHTHPSGGSTFSRKDRRTLKRIAKTPEARAPLPAMVILYGERASWNLRVGRLISVKIGKFVIAYRVQELDLRIWGGAPLGESRTDALS